MGFSTVEHSMGTFKGKPVLSRSNTPYDGMDTEVNYKVFQSKYFDKKYYRHIVTKIL